jgi:SP family general alpha glucoside:H+ symporter-like MFS transporter
VLALPWACNVNPKLTDRSKQAVICFFCIIYVYFRLPEPRGRSYAELDVLFEKKIPARKFEKTEVDVFHEHVEDKVVTQFTKVVDARASEERGRV